TKLSIIGNSLLQSSIRLYKLPEIRVFSSHPPLLDVRLARGTPIERRAHGSPRRRTELQNVSPDRCGQTTGSGHLPEHLSVAVHCVFIVRLPSAAREGWRIPCLAAAFLVRRSALASCLRARKGNPGWLRRPSEPLPHTALRLRPLGRRGQDRRLESS